MHTSRSVTTQFIAMVTILIWSSPVFAGAVISPGKSAGPYRLGMSAPSRSEQGVALEGTPVQRITITSSLYLLEGSWLRVEQSTKQDIIRFYGPPEASCSTPDTLCYGTRGLEFRIDRKTDVILAITIYPPTKRTKRINPSTLRRFKK